MTAPKERPGRLTVLLVCAVAALMLVVGVALRFPYGYYTLLRLVVALSAGFMAWKSMSANNLFFRVVGLLFGFVCLLYNPILIVHLSRSEWGPVNVLTAVLFVLGVFVKYPVATNVV